MHCTWATSRRCLWRGEVSVFLFIVVFFQRRTAKGARINHVGIYLWNRRFVHATLSAGVIISSLDETHWRSRYAGTRRPELLNNL